MARRKSTLRKRPPFKGERELCLACHRFVSKSNLARHFRTVGHLRAQARLVRWFHRLVLSFIPDIVNHVPALPNFTRPEGFVSPLHDPGSPSPASRRPKPACP